MWFSAQLGEFNWNRYLPAQKSIVKSNSEGEDLERTEIPGLQCKKL